MERHPQPGKVYQLTGGPNDLALSNGDDWGSSTVRSRPMSLAEAAQAAIDVQDAVNLSGVAHTFAEILGNVLWPEAHRLGEGTRWVNTHPISVLFTDKMADLAGRPNLFRYADALDACRGIASEVKR